jgi:hydroxyethylthiazole kinase-like sugar kinase family protein
MKKVRAKFQCSSVVPVAFEGSKDVVVNFNAVYGEDNENKSFSKSTPCGNLTMQISESTPAKDFFKQGKEYYLDFTEAE